LLRLVKLSRLSEDLYRITLVDVGDQFEYHSSGLNVAFFLVSEDNFAFNYIANTRLESNWEGLHLSRFDSYFFLLDGEILGSHTLNPVRDSALTRVGKLDVFSDKVSKNSRELNRSFGDIVR
jgi:hypothetical protein